MLGTIELKPLSGSIVGRWDWLSLDSTGSFKWYLLKFSKTAQWLFLVNHYTRWVENNKCNMILALSSSVARFSNVGFLWVVVNSHFDQKCGYIQVDKIDGSREIEKEEVFEQ